MKRLSSKPVARLVRMCIIGVAACWVLGAGWSRRLEASKLESILCRVKNMVGIVQPGIGRVCLEATSLTAYRPGEEGRKYWNIQVTDSKGDYVGETLWDIEDGQLASASWDRPIVSHKGSPRLGLREAWELAKLRLIQMAVADGGVSESSKKPQKAAGAWILWCNANGAMYRVKLDATTGALRSTERRDPSS